MLIYIYIYKHKLVCKFNDSCWHNEHKLKIVVKKLSSKSSICAVTVIAPH